MFGGAEMTRGNLPGPEQARLVATLKTFTEVLRAACLPAGLAPGQVAFLRPSNFVAVLNPDAIHVAMDDVSIGGIPDHTYLDRRQESPVLPLDAVVGAAVREFGFRRPLGVTLPLSAFSDDEAKRESALQALAVQLCTQLREHALVQSLNLPPGYEHFARFLPAFLRDQPAFGRNVFLMMRFRTGPQYDEIHIALRDELAKYGLTGR
jgi:hypothetical protein